MKANPEGGSSALAFVLLLFSLGMLMLNGLQQQLNQQQSVVASEIGFLKQYVQALSAQSWGSQLRWQAANQWRCQQQANEWRACVLVTAKGEGLMAAQEVPEHGQAPITVWRWGYIDNSRWIAAPHGWLDFCPLAETALCLLPE